MGKLIQSVDDLLSEVNTWLATREIRQQITADTDMIDTRVVDSMQFMALAVHVESLLDEDLDIGTMSIDDLRTVRRIYDKCFAAKEGATAP